MRLQTEKRMSIASNLSLDLSRQPPSLSGPPSSKRASFAPLTGTSAGRMHAHRRISSVSDTGFALGGSTLGEPSTWPPPSPRSPRILEDSDATPVDRPNKRMSLLFGRGAAPQFEQPPSDVEGEALRKQIRDLQQQLDDSKRDLVESQEAHEASELCVRALRTFISENNVGVPSAIKSGTTGPPPPPSHVSHSKQGSTASRWGFRLWASSETEPVKGTSPAPTPTTAALPPDTGFPAGQAAPRKFGGLFGSRTSTSSNGSARTPYDPVHQEPMYNGSDTSSLADSSGPISPASEMPRAGLGLGELGDKPALSGDVIDIATLSHTPEIPVAATAAAA